MSSSAHHFVSLTIHGLGQGERDPYVGQVYCTDDEIGGRTAAKASKEAALAAGFEITICGYTYAAHGWIVEAKLVQRKPRPI